MPPDPTAQTTTSVDDSCPSISTPARRYPPVTLLGDAAYRREVDATGSRAGRVQDEGIRAELIGAHVPRIGPNLGDHRRVQLFEVVHCRCACGTKNAFIPSTSERNVSICVMRPSSTEHTVERYSSRTASLRFAVL